MHTLSESELVAALDHHDLLVRLCAAGELSFPDFCVRYSNFYFAYALDGHESDPLGRALLDNLAIRIAPHRSIAETILAKACSDTDAATDNYRQSGRFGSIEAVNRLKVVAAGLPGGEA